MRCDKCLKYEGRCGFDDILCAMYRDPIHPAHFSRCSDFEYCPSGDEIPEMTAEELCRFYGI